MNLADPWPEVVDPDDSVDKIIGSPSGLMSAVGLDLLVDIDMGVRD